jgi:hypothetical protein
MWWRASPKATLSATSVSLVKSFREFLRSRDPAEAYFDHRDRRVVIAPHLILANGLARTICQKHAMIVPKIRVANGRFNADTCRATREDNVFDTRPLQNSIQIRLIESAETIFVYDDVLSLRFQIIHYVRTPGVTDQNARGLAAGIRDSLPDTQRLQMPNPVRRVGSTHIGQVGEVGHLKIDYLDAFASSSCESSRRRVNDILNGRDIESRLVEHPAFGTKVVLRIHNNDCGPLRIK